MKAKLIMGGMVLGSFFINATAQTTEEKPVEKPTVKVGGYIRSETFYDSYISTDSRDGELYYFPKRKSIDPDGTDKNEVGQFTMLGLQSRLKVSATGGNAFGAKISGVLEADFNGSADAYKFNLRLRHAYLKMDWEKTQLLFGQFWHPSIVAELAPNTVLFGSGVAFHPLNRAAQIRLTQTISENFKLMGALSSFAAHRPTEPAGTNTQRNSGLPEINLQAQLGNIKSFFISLTGGYKFLRPYVNTYTNKVSGGTGVSKDSIFASTQIIGSYYVAANVGYSNSVLSAKAQCVYGENLTYLNMIGGYAPVKGSKNSKGEYEYTNMNTLSTWLDLETKGSKVKIGLFAGFSQNLGANDSVEFVNKTVDSKISLNTKTDLCREADLSLIYRLAPRVYFIQGPVDIGVEYSITGANYGTFSGKEIINMNDKSVNHRILLSVRYTF